jgi:hypothetical protein
MNAKEGIPIFLQRECAMNVGHHQPVERMFHFIKHQKLLFRLQGQQFSELVGILECGRRADVKYRFPAFWEK